jgi:putative transposase
MLTVVADGCPGHGGGKDDAARPLIDEIVREGARRMLAEALRAEVDAYSAGAVEVTVPWVHDKRTDPVTGERRRFSSAILPPWARKTPKVTEVLPLLYLHGAPSRPRTCLAWIMCTCGLMGSA